MSWTVLDHENVRALETPARVIAIGLDGFDVSKDKALMTADVAVCAAVALLPVKAGGECALLHVFADPKLFAQGHEAIALHARHLWHKFTENLDTDEQYRAIAFGGRKGDTPAQYVSEVLNDTLFESVKNSGFISEAEDRRYLSTRAETVVINPKSRQIALGEDVHFYGMDDLEDAPRQFGRVLTPRTPAV